MCRIYAAILYSIKLPCGGRIIFNMTSKERHELRYQRRKKRREAKKIERCKAIGQFEDIFQFSTLYKHGKNCCRGVRWKNSTQRFELSLFSQTAKTRKEILGQTWTPSKYYSFTLSERGKTRNIDAPKIQDRQVHKVITKEILLPLYLPDMIYNNGASLPGKGLHFSFRMLKEDLRWHFRRYGMDGAIILIDFKQFFPSASHQAIYERHNRLIIEPGLKALCDKIVSSSGKDKGMPLGVEPSQVEMIGLPSPLDNYVKCQLGIKCAGHYMDDYYIMVPPHRDAKDILAKFVHKAASLGFIVNLNKTKIQSLEKPFRYCKAKFTLTSTGRIIMNGNRDSVKRARRKIRAFKKMYDAGMMSFDDVYMSVQSSLAYFKNYNDHNRLLRLRRLFYSTFGMSAEQQGQ